MKKIWVIFFPLVFLLGNSSLAQQQTAEIQSDISREVAVRELPTINLDASLGYQSNIDLLDKQQYQVKYKDSGIVNLGANTKITSEMMDKTLTFNSSLKGLILQDGNYDRSSDVLRRVNFNNSFYLEAIKSEKFSLGPVLDLNAEKRFTHPGFHRKRDNINGSIGLKSSYKASSTIGISSSVSGGYVDHSGNYVDQSNPNRRFEHSLEEDRAIYKGNFTTVWKATSLLTLSVPVSYQRDNFTQRRARAAKRGFSANVS